MLYHLFTPCHCHRLKLIMLYICIYCRSSTCIFCIVESKDELEAQLEKLKRKNGNTAAARRYILQIQYMYTTNSLPIIMQIKTIRKEEKRKNYIK